MISAPPSMPTSFDARYRASLMGRDGSHQWFTEPRYGYIMCAEIEKGGTGLVRALFSGWKHLPELGSFHWGDYYTKQPFEHFFQAGGAHLMPMRQVLEMGYQFFPPIIPKCGKRVGDYRQPHGRHGHDFFCWDGATPVVFPQLEGKDYGPAPMCDLCENELKYPSVKARDQHVKVMHTEELREIRTGQAMAKQITDTLTRMGMGVPTGIQCPMCNEMPVDVQALVVHVAKHAAQAQPEVPSVPVVLVEDSGTPLDEPILEWVEAPSSATPPVPVVEAPAPVYGVYDRTGLRPRGRPKGS
jgi:hypothetical protein